MAEQGRPAGQEPAPCDIMVTNGYVVTMDGSRRIFAPGAVAIAGRRIAAVGPEREIRARYRASRSFDAGGAVVHPGLIDPHLHIVHGSCRGVFSNPAVPQPVTFPDWKADVTPDDEHVATKLAALEMLRRGFTCFIEPGTVFDGDAVAGAAATVGVRGLLSGPYLWDQLELMEYMGGLRGGALFQRVPPDLDRCLAQLGRELDRNRNPDALVRGYVSVYGLGTASDRLLQAAKACADQAGVVFHQHEGYVPEASAEDRRRLGKPRIVHLEDLGVLGSNATLIHMSVMGEDEVAPVRRTGTSMVWCPIATMHLTMAKGVPCRLPGLYKQGVNIALGVDGAQDVTVGTAGLLAYHVAQGFGEPIAPEHVLEMQTVAAAQVAGMEAEIGSLEPGKRADLVIRGHGIESYPATNPVHQLMLTAGPGSAETVIVDGEVVLHAGTSTRLDERAVAEEAKTSVLRRLSRLGLSSGLGWQVTA
jgi:cytosine/adenosine deaminase-related metal-dependent hydrolase